jgi:hypothetical protein
MARPCRYAISKVEECRSIDLADLRRWHMLDPARLASTGKIPAVTWNTPNGLDELGVVAQPRGVLFVRRDEQGHLGKLFVPFTFTPTKFGGWRAWFRCPGCGQGCRVLYGVNSLRCRKCRRLKYQSQYEMPAFRLLERARKIRRRLGAPGEWGSTGPLPPKPRYMRWRRYRRLEQLVWRLEAAGWAAMSVHVGGMRRRMR